MKDFVIALAGITVLSAVLIFINNSDKKIKENFGGIPSRAINRDLNYKVENKYGSAMFSVPPNYQANISPRFSNIGYGAQIRYNIPEQKNLAVPTYPVTFEGNVRENYESSQVGGMGNSGYRVPQLQGPNSELLNQAALSNGMTNQQLRSIDSFSSDAANGIFSTGSDSSAQMDIGGEPMQVYNYDRLMYAQKKSRLNRHGDPIRGDLAITPIQGDWFRPSVNPNIDLRQGAMTVIAGFDNSTDKELRALQSLYSGKTALAQKDIELGGAQSDIIITAFP